MRIENTEVYGFKAALRGCRNPKDSWNNSDSIKFGNIDYLDNNCNVENFILGEADKKLSQQLTKAGSEHCKHLRFIQVWADLILPRYIWQELDTYKHIEKISCSTMHRLMSYDLTADMFEGGFDYISESHISTMQDIINAYKASKDTDRKKQLKLRVKRLLPESFLQKRTINTNYQQLYNILNQRSYHELPEWNINDKEDSICNWITQLPYFIELTGWHK
jgi:hypothetical protein